MPFIVGGLAAASSIMSGISGAGQSKANARAAQMQQEQQNFQNRWQNEAQNRNLLRQWEAQQVYNKQLEASANRQLATGKYYAKESFKNSTSAFSRQTKQANAAFLGTVSSKGMSVDSASARALLRQSVEEANLTSRTARLGLENQMRDMETNYANMLSSRNLNGPQQQTLLTGKAVTVDSSSSLLMTGIATGLLGGASAGISAYGEYGWDKSLSGKLFK